MLPALVLTAGLGKRLDPITRLVAKPAVPLGDRTLIERVLAWLERQQVRDLVLNLHHRPETIAAVVGDGAHLGVRVRYSWEQPVLGSAGGPRRALPLLDADTFLVVNGDTLSNVDLAAMHAAHRRSGADVTMAVVPNPAPDHYNGIAIDDDGVVLGFVPKGEAHGTWHFIGIQIVSRRIFEPLADGVAAETVAALYRDIVRVSPGRIRALPVETTFIDVGTPRDYLAAAATFPAPPADIDPGARVINSVIWPEARISAGADLDQCIVAGRVDIPDGFRATNCALIPASAVSAGETVEIEGGVAVFRI
ncbi:MAG TPA: sugar phosphate nucleotidyltransferase [Vicinamibacterales bacterium]|nr:sugar phosphate nucleotidyltransferase [Vicinamibacterales bacterium]